MLNHGALTELMPAVIYGDGKISKDIKLYSRTVVKALLFYCQ